MPAEIIRRADHRQLGILADAHGNHVLLDAMARPNAGIEAIAHDQCARVALAFTLALLAFAFAFTLALALALLAFAFVAARVLGDAREYMRVVGNEPPTVIVRFST